MLLLVISRVRRMIGQGSRPPIDPESRGAPDVAPESVTRFDQARPGGAARRQMSM
jgi:hypothetical protein